MNSAMGYTEGSEMYQSIVDHYKIPNKPLSDYESATFNMEETTTKPKSSHISTAVKALERQIAKDEAAVSKLNAKKNEIDVSIELLRESINGLSSEVERLRNRE